MMRSLIHSPALRSVLCLLLLPALHQCMAETTSQDDVQSYVSRYDIFNGFNTLDTPHLNLVNRGYNFQIGRRFKTWESIGFDYTITTGHDTLLPRFLPTALQQRLAAQLLPLILAGVIPPTFQVQVPVDSKTQTFAFGPQFTYRHFARVPLFIRPSFGAVRETATPHPGDPINASIAHQLAPAGHKTDWTGFYGFGGGYDVNVTKHVALRMQSDLTYYHLFNDLLRDGTWNVRWSVGPAFNFGSNIRAAKRVQPVSASSAP